MSAVQSNERYKVGHGVNFPPPWEWSVVDWTRGGYEVDRYRSQCVARYAAKLLNEGRAVVNPHAVIGCRVEVQS